MILELKELGFKEVELSFNLTEEMVKAVEKMAARGEVIVSSLHNFCPIPPGLTREEALPDCFSMSSPDERQRQLSVKYAKRTIDAAARLNAGAVVLHCGRVDMRDLYRDLLHMFNKGQGDTPEFVALRSEMLEARAELRGPYVANVLRSLDELNRHAERRKISLGVETRYYYSEIPTMEEVGVILDKFRGGRVFYWHDAGHAQVMENLGIATQEDFLARYKDSLLGLHLHDVRGTSDHRPPGKADLDFKRLVPFVSPAARKVLEIHYPAGPDEVRKGRDFLESVFDGKA
jgi:sugar phosphate isomerase/epimerase